MAIDYTTGQKQIDEAVKVFFSVFDNRSGRANITPIYDLFTDDGRIVKCLGDKPESYPIREFADSRAIILSSGNLTDFYEEEVFGKTDIFGHIAQRISIYRKEGVMSGNHFEAYGVKTMQFVYQDGVYKMYSVTWDDEREGFELDENIKKYGFK